MLLLVIEYGNEIWDCNKGQANALESILLGGSKKFWDVLLEHVKKLFYRGDMGLDILRAVRIRPSV